MAKHTYVRLARATDTEDFLKWSFNTPRNLYDPDSGLYATTRTFCAYNKERKVLFVPVQTPFFMEALAINPEASELEIATALKEVTQHLVSLADAEGRGELYFFCTEESTQAFAKHQAFQEIPFKLYRLKLKDLEPKCESTQE